MIASLGMYDLPGLSGALDRLWFGIRDSLRLRGVDAPETLDRRAPLWDAWRSPGLVIGQTCGLPYRTKLHQQVTLLGSFDFGLADTPRGYYHSVFVVRSGDQGDIKSFADRRLAINGFDSESGWAAAQATASAHGFAFSQFLHTGAHIDSAEAVLREMADVAAIDAVTWRLLRSHQPGDLAGLKVIARSEPTPGLPLITAARANVQSYRAAVRDGLNSLAAQDKADLGIVAFVDLPAEAYLSVPLPPLPSQDRPADGSGVLQSGAFPA